MDKTAITSSGNELSSAFDKRFGRAAYYCIYDEAEGITKFIKNENINAPNGAGTRAVEKMIELKVNKIISGDFGPKAKDILSRFDIQMIVLQDDKLTIQDIIHKLKSNH